jgi:hypothetical protein
MFEDDIIQLIAHAIVFDEIADKVFAKTCEETAQHFKETMRKARPEAFALKERFELEKSELKKRIAAHLESQGLVE